jgi:alpha 1,2-mannosyltransferase
MSNDHSFYNVDTNISSDEIKKLNREWKEYLSQDQDYFGQEVGEGKGIVLTAGGIKYFTAAWILITRLRKIGCLLPIELWFFGNEITSAMQEELSRLNVSCRDLEPFIESVPNGFLMKPLAILYSSFQEVLFLDADNNCLQDPTYLFHNEDYLKLGAVFWPDFWTTAKWNPIWKILDIDYSSSNEQESGQLLINKKLCWDQLQLCLYFNLRSDVYSRFLYGDKDTFRFAWMALKKEFYMISTGVGSCGYLDKSDNSFCGTTMVQYDPDGEMLFLHRNMLKWDVTRNDHVAWELVKVFSKHSSTNKIFSKIASNGHMVIDLQGNISKLNFKLSYPSIESECLLELSKLRRKDFYIQELLNYYINKNK